MTFTTHDLSDDVLGTIFTGLNYTLTPGSSVNTVAAGLSIPYVVNSTTTNTGTWTAHDAAGAPTQATASATVTVGAGAPSITLSKTVGTTPGVCAATNSVTVTTGTDVYYCFVATNTGDGHLRTSTTWWTTTWGRSSTTSPTPWRPARRAPR